jgi:surface polysaccharide O-acyltransferase-like enzyme
MASAGAWSRLRGKLAQRWWLWSIRALLAFVIAGAIGFAAATQHLGSRGWEVASYVMWVISCAATSFALLALFARFAKNRSKVFDSLTANAYGIYLIHYAFVSWLQLAMLKSQIPAIAKGTLVFVGAVLLSWGVTAALRKIPVVAKVI